MDSDFCKSPAEVPYPFQISTGDSSFEYGFCQLKPMQSCNSCYIKEKTHRLLLKCVQDIKRHCFSCSGSLILSAYLLLTLRDSISLDEIAVKL